MNEPIRSFDVNNIPFCWILFHNIRSLLAQFPSPGLKKSCKWIKIKWMNSFILKGHFNKNYFTAFFNSRQSTGPHSEKLIVVSHFCILVTVLCTFNWLRLIKMFGSGWIQTYSVVSMHIYLLQGPESSFMMIMIFMVVWSRGIENTVHE